MAMKRISDITLKVEEILAAGLLCLISVLVFGSAVARTIGVPINWAQDIALLAFAWLTFLGADVVAKSGRLINIDMLTNQLPKVVQKLLGIVFDMMMLLFLFILIVYGFLLVSQSWSRMFNTLKLSYAWCTLAVPVGALLLFTTAAGMLVRDIRKPAKDWGRRA
ncbi:TRAP transporter small permease [Enterocloster citroniae]|jgi:TRAP-type C4-dicarboxylate transport system permease small subunit|nr:TRAP transporter small permease [Enterocloster citroniae]MCB7066963.1 TRAP transporter small permease [Enterocloster citroniae]MCC8082651.1 TRAP transporter small permease [Clostridium sp.]MCD8277176.1 TRAP transporter small permease [Enterocloster citroniae]